MNTTAPVAATVNALVSRWAAMYPDLAERLARAAALVANVRRGDYSRDVFFVEGSEGHSYMVRVNRKTRTSTCTCPDHQERQLRCKHILAVALLVVGCARKVKGQLSLRAVRA